MLKSFLPINQVSSPRFRVFCFPYAGGGHTTFSDWPDYIDNDIEVLVVSLPGKGKRFSEPAIDNMEELVNSLLFDFKQLSDVPYLFFGHSLGARVAFALAKELEQLTVRQPLQLVVSGSPAPNSNEDVVKLSDKPDHEFIEKLHIIGGTPPEVLAQEELMELLLPSIRADFKIAEEYQCLPHQLNVPITVFTGKEDRDVNQSNLSLWQGFSKNPISINHYDGGHFFIETHKNALKDLVTIINDNAIEPEQLVI
ncbi:MULTISPECIES: thioesterase II family protein [Pseudoalteromonas]|uniref:Thioesterase domain-containing protein n=1 Tax=Pseudoalteromonas obscura TaxID=3048491 RepID=A0ABT7EH43_9GAMM|nr:thioesterase [Pseudoalteromonas sp. P94(2023)]MBQ4836013.1 thioesterase [Pseudoalteromonas luteoviolacea]MDK2594363.1 thioesterase domain-containing protein [Pseudoalteromonas sp. P94(2023)]